MTTHTVLARTTGKPHELEFIAGNEFMFERTTRFTNDRIPPVPPETYMIAVFQVTTKRRYLSRVSTAEPIFDELKLTARSKLLIDSITILEADSPLTSITKATKMTALFISQWANVLHDEGFRLENWLKRTESMRLIMATPRMRTLYEASPELMDEILGTIYKDAPTTQMDRFNAKYGETIARGRAAAKVDPTLKPPVETHEAEAHEDEQPKRMSKLEGMQWLNGVLVQNRDLAIFETMRKLDDHETANILMIGPSGCGKTSIPAAYAEHVGMEMIRMNCAAVRDPEEWFGYREAIDGSTEFIATDFTKRIRAGNVVVILDEFNRVEPWLHNTLLPLLDHARKTVVHNEEIKCGPHTIFVATMNMGARFTGTFALDAAILNRFDAVINVSYLPAEAETKLLKERTGVDAFTSRKIVHILSKFRQQDDVIEYGLDVSTRSSLKIAKLVAGGFVDIRTAIGYVIMNAIDDAALLKSLNDLIIANL